MRSWEPMERAFANEPFLRRLAKVAHLGAEARVLELAPGDASLGLLLAQALQCRVTVVDEDAQLLQAIADKARALSLGARLVTRQGGLAALEEARGTFEAVVIAGGMGLTVQEGALCAREFLAQDGRLCRLHPVRVGIGASIEAWRKAWEDQLGETLPSPTALLQAVERAGFESETIEALSEAEMEAGFLLSAPPEEELALYRAANGTTTIRATYCAAIARRREPGEKPPASGDRG